jgi:hypothetical protein
MLTRGSSVCNQNIYCGNPVAGRLLALRCYHILAQCCPVIRCGNALLKVVPKRDFVFDRPDALG